ncbi:unnamed protein product [Phaeothamnion confervicola]
MLITSGRVLTPNGFGGPSRLVIEAGCIAAIEAGAGDDGLMIVPGFVDVQVNGIDDVDVSTAGGADWDRLDGLLLDQGVTTWCPTLVTMPLDRFTHPLAEIGAAMARPTAGRPSIAGAHLEGPFLGGAPGAHRPQWIVPIDLGWIDSLPDHIAVMTIGAEQVDAAAATARMAARGTLVSVGHTTAAFDELDAVAAAGASLATHLFNGMSGLHHRTPGVAAWVLDHPSVAASVIADGVHVHPRMIKLAFSLLGRDRAVLVTDAVAWRAGTVGPVGMELRDGAPRLADGTLAGSAATMDHCLRVCIAAGVDAELALRAASTTPARLLGLADRGAIDVGRRADLVALDADWQIRGVWVAGEQVR